MKKYETPELESVKYDVEDCLTGSTDIPKESEKYRQHFRWINLILQNSRPV